jgi:hypothetical protein
VSRTSASTPSAASTAASRNFRRLLTVSIATLAALIALPMLGGSTASAHSGTQSYVYLEIFDDAIAGRVEYPIDDLNEVLGLDIAEDDVDQALEDFEIHRATVEAYTDQHLALFPIDGAPGDWALEFGEATTLEESSGDYVILDFEVDQQFDPPPRQFNVTYDGIYEAKADRDAFLLIATDFGSGTFNNEANTLLRFTPGDSNQQVDLDDSSFWKGVAGTIGLGAEHIQIGTDHILFILALVLPSALVFTRRTPDAERTWEPSPSFVQSLWRILKVATMFTIAHSITLAIGGFEILELSPRLVETIIAISIAIAALHNIHPIWPNKEWVMAFAFGLFHGFGFAGLLTELGLDRSNRFVSLLGFNIGVEIGQAAIIVMVFPILFIMRRTRVFVPLMYAGSVLLALVSLAWAAERIFDYDTDVNSLVDPILRWPRSAVLLIGILVIATAIYAYDRSKGALRPVAHSTEPEAAEEEPELVDA